MKFISIVIFLLITSSYHIVLGQTNKSKIAEELLVELELGHIPQTSEKHIYQQQLIAAPNIWHLRYASAQEAERAYTNLEQNRHLKHIQYNHVLSWRTAPNDPRYTSGLQWNMELIGAETAWNYTTGGLTPNGDTIVVAIIDNGCDIMHEDLVDNIWHNHAEIPNNGIDDDNNGWVDDYNGWNVIDDNDQHALEVHGTSVAGIVGASGNNNKGITGINWNTKLMILSGNDVALTTEANAVEAYAYILEARRSYNETNGAKGAFVVATNASFGIDGANAADYPIWCGLYDALGEVGVLSVAVTANAAVDVDEVGDMPTTCSSEYLIAVTQTTDNDQLHPSAAYGLTHIDIGAPGSVFTTRPNDTYNLFGGTSGASPHVAGAIALLYSYPQELWGELMQLEPSSAASLVKNILLNTAEPIIDLDDKSVSEGRLALGGAMEKIDEYFETPTATEILLIYPNPTKTELQFKLSLGTNKDYQLQIVDILGREHYTTTLSFDRARIYEHELAIEDWASGVYILRLLDGQQVHTQRFVKY